MVILSASGSGKTSLGESILFLCGNSDKPGKPGDRSSLLDFEEEEITRGMSVATSVATVDWKGFKFNFLDTPGNSAFHSDTKNAIRASDSSVFVFSAADGMKVESEWLWRYAEQHTLPSIIFINKLDRENSDFFTTISVLEESLNIKPLILYLPIGKDAEFKGAVDLINQKVILYGENPKKEIEGKIPEELKPQLEEYRKKMVESLAEIDDKTLEKYLNGEELSQEDLISNLKKGVRSRSVFPVLCGSVVKLIGVSTFLDIISELMPSPLELSPVKGKEPLNGNELTRKHSLDEPFSGWVFRTIIDQFVGKISYVRIFSGVINSETQVLNSAKNIKERIGSIQQLKGKKQEQKPYGGAGDIIAFPKLKETLTGNTLCNEKSPILFPTVEMPNAVISFAIRPRTKSDEDKLANSLSKIMEEDPTLQVQRDQQTKETIIAGVDQTQIELAVERLKRKYSTEVEIATPKVPYKETIKGKSRVQGKYKKQSGGRGQYGDCWLEVEPLPRGKGYEFRDRIVGGVIPKQFIPSIEKGVKEAMIEGVVAGYPVTDVRVSVVDGSFHEVDSSDIAFKIAGAMALRKTLQEAKPILLEPIMSMEIVVPDESIGDVIGDMNSRRGKILGVEATGGYQTIKAHAPMSEVLGYASDLRSLTQGRGNFTIKLYTYEEVPSQIAEKIIEKNKKENKGEKSQEE